MKSIKPGRGPSMMGGVVGIVMICFGVLWTVLAASISGIFAVFGVLWTAIAVMITVYNFKNATGKNRYSAFDITDANEEPDPLEERFGGHVSAEKNKDVGGMRFCPYCGNASEPDHHFCAACGKKLP